MRVAQPKQRRIGEYTYVVLPLPSGVALEMKRRFAVTLGGALEKWGGLDNLVPTFGSLLRSLSADDLDYIVKSCVNCTEVKDSDGKQVPLSNGYNEQFRGAVDEQFQWLIFALEVTYGSFLEWLSSETKGIKLDAAKVLQSIFRTGASGTRTGSQPAAGTAIPST